jgi:phospholipase C
MTLSRIGVMVTRFLAPRSRTVRRARHAAGRALVWLEPLEDRIQPSASPLSQIDHFVVIYQENWSFDGLYGSFPGANGLSSATDANGNLLPQFQQVDKNGNPITTLPNPSTDPHVPGGLPAKPYDLSPYVAPTDKTNDIVHRFYTEQLQIGNGALQPGTGDNNKFVTWSDNQNLVLSNFNATNLPEGLLAQQYTMDDNFFHAAYGGSFLNHQFLVAAMAPQWNQPIPAGFQSSWDPTTQTLKDGNLTIDGKYDVNTTFSANLVPSFVAPGSPTLLNSINDSSAADPNRPYEQNIGDLLSGKGLSWKWYSGGWDAAVNLQKAYQSGDPAQIAAAKAPFNDPTNPLNLFQWHHQPLAYFDNYSPLSAGGQAHLQDETNFFADLASEDLPAVSFIKPLGPDNEHPGYASLLAGQQHVADIVHAIQNNPAWKHTMIIVTYDENGGRWDHVSPPHANGTWGDGTRVPGIVISPYAKQGFVDHTQHDTLSILKTIETRFGLPSLNQFDAAASDLSSSLQSTPHASIGSAYVQPDANNPGKFALIVQGTEGSDRIHISADGTAIRVRIDGDDVDYDHSFSQPISRLEVYTQGGNDHVTVDPAVTVPAFLFAGDGHDVLKAGGGPRVLVGGDDGDVLKGGAGPAILIGGKGKNKLVAGSGDTILIGGTTTWDANLAALKGLEAEWSRTDATFAQRMAHLNGGATGGLNGPYLLNSSTVSHDDSRNRLIGGSGHDWFFAHLARRHGDLILDPLPFDVKPGDEVTAI